MTRHEVTHPGLSVLPIADEARSHAWRTTKLLLVFFLGGCLTPVPSYQRSDLEASATELRHIAILPIEDRQGQMLRALLEERFATKDKKLSKTHTLSVTLETDNEERDFGRARIVSKMQATARFVLRDKRTKEKQILFQGTVAERSNYTATSGFLTRRDAEEEALRHVLALVADEMLLRLRLYFFTQASKDREKDSSQP